MAMPDGDDHGRLLGKLEARIVDLQRQLDEAKERQRATDNRFLAGLLAVAGLVLQRVFEVILIP